ncbi:MAG: peroxide stress protein YaaA [Planctomycetota bacterium]
MLILISPAKTLDFEHESPTRTWTEPDQLVESARLVEHLRGYSPPELGELMQISPKLAELNVRRFEEWRTPFTPANAKQAVFAFQGDVYQGLRADTLSGSDLKWAQNHLRILSGLYGLLRPLDLIQPYRLEMGTPLETDRGRSLYAYWGDQITDAVAAAMRAVRTRICVNLASQEYFKAIRPERLPGDVVTPIFKERSGGKLRVMALFAKRARGTMTRAIVRHRWRDAADLRGFGDDRYQLLPEESTDTTLVFAREHSPRKG